MGHRSLAAPHGQALRPYSALTHLDPPDRVLKLVWPGLRLPVLTLTRTLRFILVRPGMAFPMTRPG